MTLEPLRAELMAMSTDREWIRRVMALVVQIEAAAYVRGSNDTKVPT